MAQRGLNKVMIIGNLGQAPEVCYTAGGDCIASMSIATSETWKDKNTGDTNEKTEWHRVVFFRRLAEVCRDYLNKGSKVYIEGRLETRKWQDKSGNDRYTTEIIGAEMQMLDGRQSAAPPQQASPPIPGTTPQAPTSPNDDFDDDIPF